MAERRRVPHNQDDSHTMGGVAANPRREVSQRKRAY
jgi:hypothetical protein